MQDLPEELQEEILLSLKEPKDLQRACSASRQNREICSGSAFWRAKFAREGLPLLEQVVRSPPDLLASHSSSEQGKDFFQWIKLYAKALQASRLAEEQLHTDEVKGVNLEQLPDLSYLPGLEEFLQPFYNEVKSGENVERTVRQVRAPDEPLMHIEFHDDYIVYLHPAAYGYRYEVTERRRIFRDGILTRDNTRPIYASRIMTSDQAWNILYRLFYFGILF
ncbi:F-box domain [Cedratvirus A11]|uniref:F-box domain n=1 Tax=Cedratvirus A11 TaxID=1903266 RepID=A0A1M7XUE0_9VIRU|nr:F-box domain [Cedratvirus A11]SHO33314.1 F-box domain [Cedratvirus A11]